MEETEEQSQARLDLYFLGDLEHGLKRESEFMSRDKDKYMDIMSGKDLRSRMAEDGISLDDKPEKIRRLGNRPESKTRNGLLIHCIIKEI